MPAGNTLTNPSVWMREIIKDRIEIILKTKGDYLAGTMIGGDEEAGTFKFPIGTGSTNVYRLTGSIEPVMTGGLGIDYVSVQPTDYEVADYLRQQDLDRIGPSMQNYVAEMLARAVRKQRDWIKLDALAAFMGVAAPPTTIGGIGQTIDITHVEQVGNEIRALGFDEPIYCPVPHGWMSQLKFYDEFSHADYIGSGELPFAKREGVEKRTWNGVQLFSVPDDVFEPYAPDGNNFYTWAWCYSAMAAQNGKSVERPDMQQQFNLQGSPWLMKGSVSGAALGINAKGVKRLHFKRQSLPTRPA